MDDLLHFSLAVALVLATPGPTNTLLAASGALVGIRRSLPLIAGEIAGYLVAMAAIHFILENLVGDAAGIRSVLRLAIVAYLVYTAYRLWTWKWQVGGKETPVTTGRVFVTTLLNPKALVFALVVIPWTSGASHYYLGMFSVYVVLIASAWISLGALLRSASAPRLINAVPRLSALALVCFAALVAAR